MDPVSSIKVAKRSNKSIANRRRPPVRLFLVAIFVSLGASFNFGFQLTLTNPCQAAFIQFLNGSIRSHYDIILDGNHLEALWSGIVAILYFGALIGALCLRVCAERFGRKLGLALGYGLSLASFALAISSYFFNSFEIYMFSRICMGISVSISVGMAGMFLTESSPKECRGSVSMTMGVMMQTGTLMGSLIGMPQLLGTPANWWLIYVVESVPLVFVLSMLPFLHETPGHLLMHDDERKARRAIHFYHVCDEQRINIVIAELKRDISLHTSRSMSMLDVWRLRGHTRRATAVGCMLSFALVFSGTAVLAAYAVEIFHSSGFTLSQSSVANVGLSLVTVISCITATFIVDRFGRRQLLLTMYTIMFFINCAIFSLLLLYETFYYDWTAICLLVLFSCFAFCFAMGPGPMSFFITSELLGQNARSAGQSWMYIVQMLWTFCVTVFLPMRNWLGASWSYLILFVAPIFFAVFFFYFELPETKGRNIIEVECEFERLPTLKKVFNCRIFAASKNLNLVEKRNMARDSSSCF